MCYQYHGFVAIDQLDYPENTQTNPEPSRIKHVFQSRRHCTDKYWIVLFVAIFIIWIRSWNYSIISDGEISKTMQGSTEVLNHSTNCEVGSVNSEVINDTPKFIVLHWIFNTITCNITFLDTHSKTNSSILVFANALFCVALIAYIFTSMRPSRVFLAHIEYFGKFFIVILIQYRILIFLLANTIVQKMLALQLDYKTAWWVIPEAMLIIIWLTKRSYRKDSEENDVVVAETINFQTYFKHVLLMHCLFVLHFKLLISFTVIAIYDRLDWDNPSFYAFAGGSCYLALILFHFQLMVNACATSLAIGNPADKRTRILLGASYIVGRYHFGTVCYHATLILPRLHAILVMNEAEFRKNPKLSAVDKFCIFWKFHNFSLIITAVLGKNHAGSIKELLRLSTRNSSIMKHFQGFANLCTSLLILLGGVNSLLLTLLWSQGNIVDPYFPMGTWQMIFIVMVWVYLYIKCHDAVLDAIWLHVDHENMVLF